MGSFFRSRSGVQRLQTVSAISLILCHSLPSRFRVIRIWLRSFASEALVMLFTSSVVEMDLTAKI